MSRILMDFAYPNFSWEAEKANTMFITFLKEGLHYDDLSNNPDYMVYASSFTLQTLLPQIIQTMMDKNNQINILVYGIMSALDAGQEKEYYRKRAQDLRAAFDPETVALICKFLHSLDKDPPREEEVMERVKAFWNCGSPNAPSLQGNNGVGGKCDL